MSSRPMQDEPGRSVRVDDPWEPGDVPAAVVCARCGEPECLGCEVEATTKSGIVAIVPWERPGGTPLGRLWTTARATTKDADAFFGALPDGPIAPAVAFALLAEILATAAWGFVWAPVLVAVFPHWCKHVATDPDARRLALRVIVAAVPAFALLLVGAHAAPGLALDHGARKVGALSARRKALRFGLYATGWDLTVGPLGACLIAWKEGILASGALAQLASGLPTRSAKAFLRGIYGLDPARTKRALVSSYVAAVVATLAAAFIVIAALIVTLLCSSSGLMPY